MLKALFCWGTLGSDIYVDVILTCSTYHLIIVAAPFIATVIFIGSENVLQDNVPCNTTKMVSEWTKVSTWPLNSPDLSSSVCGACWTNKCAL